MTRELAGTAALSEFVAGYNGDCGETAELVAMHVAKGVPLDAASLGQYVQRAVANGLAGTNGAEPLSSIAADLQAMNIPISVYGYGQPFEVNWQQIFADNAGIKPIIVQVANAGMLPGDETGVHYHFFTILGTTIPNFYIVADGDNVRAKTGQVVYYSTADMAAADICGIILVDIDPAQMPQSPPPAVSPYTFNADGTAVDNRTHQTLGVGFAGYVKANNVTSPCLLGDFVYGGSGDTVASFQNGLILHWKAGEPVTDNLGGYVVAGMANAMKA